MICNARRRGVAWTTVVYHIFISKNTFIVTERNLPLQNSQSITAGLPHFSSSVPVSPLQLQQRVLNWSFPFHQALSSMTGKEIICHRTKQTKRKKNKHQNPDVIRARCSCSTKDKLEGEGNKLTCLLNMTLI